VAGWWICRWRGRRQNFRRQRHNWRKSKHGTQNMWFLKLHLGHLTLPLNNPTMFVSDAAPCSPRRAQCKWLWYATKMGSKTRVNIQLPCKQEYYLSTKLKTNMTPIPPLAERGSPPCSRWFESAVRLLSNRAGSMRPKGNQWKDRRLYVLTRSLLIAWGIWWGRCASQLQYYRACTFLRFQGFPNRISITSIHLLCSTGKGRKSRR